MTTHLDTLTELERQQAEQEAQAVEIRAALDRARTKAESERRERRAKVWRRHLSEIEAARGCLMEASRAHVLQYKYERSPATPRS